MAVRGFDVIYTEIDMFLPEINRGDIRVLLRDKRRRGGVILRQYSKFIHLDLLTHANVKIMILYCNDLFKDLVDTAF